MLKISDLVVNYGAIQALRGVSLEVRLGEIVSIIGGNGAGKSTLMNTISGLEQTTSGKVVWDEQDMEDVPAHQRVALGISQSPEGRQVFADQTVEDNLMLGAYLRSARDPDLQKDLENQYQIFPRLLERKNQLAGTLSGGEQQMLAIARALMSKPKLLLLDEPSLGLAPLIVREIFTVIQHVRAQGVTILLVEQMANQALKISDRAYVLKNGLITASGSAVEIANDPSVREAYLGKH
jgi:branched-chain amino acid transport system ATP-binding protein